MPAGAVIFRDGLAKPAASARTVSLAGGDDSLGDLCALHFRHNGDIRKAVFAIERAAHEDAKGRPGARTPRLGEFPPDLLADWRNMNGVRAAVALGGASRFVKGKPGTVGLLGLAEPVAGWAPATEGAHGRYGAGFVRVGGSNPTPNGKAAIRILKPSFAAVAAVPLSERKILIVA